MPLPLPLVAFHLLKTFREQERKKKEKFVIMHIWTVMSCDWKKNCSVPFEWQLKWFQLFPFFPLQHWKKCNQSIGSLGFVIAQQWEYKIIKKLALTFFLAAWKVINLKYLYTVNLQRWIVKVILRKLKLRTNLCWNLMLQQGFWWPEINTFLQQQSGWQQQ